MFNSEKKTVLYHAANAGCFVKCLLHRCIYHPDDEAYFIGYEGLEKGFGVPYKFSKNIGYIPFIGPPGAYNNETAESILSRIESNFDNLLKQNNIDLKKIDKIYIGSYYADFAIYVNSKKIKHSIFEEGAGDWKKLYWSGYDTFNTLIEQFNMSMYNNELVENRYGIFSQWPIENKTDKDINFEAYKEIYKLSEDDKRFFQDYFNLPQNFEITNQYNILILTQWYTINYKKMKAQEELSLYKVLLDYYIPQDKDTHIFIKPHPADPAKKDYCTIENVSIIESNCISELLGLINNIHFDLALTVSSTSISSINTFTDSSYSIGYNIIFHYTKLNKLYFIFEQIEQFIDYAAIYRYGIMDNTYDMLRKSDFIPNDISWHTITSAGKSLIVADQLKWSDNSPLIDIEKIDTDTICFFINLNELNNASVSNLSDLTDNSIFFELTEYEKNDLTQVEKQYVCCFCKNKKILGQLKLFTGSHFFKYQNKLIVCSSISDVKADIVRLKIYNNILNGKMEEH